MIDIDFLNSILCREFETHAYYQITNEDIKLPIISLDVESEEPFFISDNKNNTLEQTVNIKLYSNNIFRDLKKLKSILKANDIIFRTIISYNFSDNIMLCVLETTTYENY